MEALPLQRRNLAEQTCLACRKQKRKCTRELPECARCRQNRRICEYSISSAESPNSDRVNRLKDEITRLESQLRGHTASSDSIVVTTTAVPSQEQASPKPNFPPLFFLDFSAFQHGGSLVVAPTTKTPPHFSQRIRNTACAHHIADLYFVSTHTYFPIVSKIRTYQQLSKSFQSLNLDTILLLMCMQLHTPAIDSQESPFSELYSSAKGCYAFAESQNIYSIRLLQAGVLVALYEVAHAIYPAAYLTIGNCARVGYAMGIHDLKSAPQMLHQPGSRNEQEERVRTWWGVTILDRYVNAGSSNRPFACNYASPDDLLPMDDRLWDQGEVSVAQPLAAFSSTTIFISPFARTCQASHLLSRVLGHLSDPMTDVAFRYQEANQLHVTLTALCATLTEEMQATRENAQDHLSEASLFQAVALCYSAILNLYDCYFCSEKGEEFAVGAPEQLKMQNIALTGIHEVSNSIVGLVAVVQAFTNREGLLRVSPLLTDCLYQAATNNAWLFHESQNPRYLPIVADIKALLGGLAERWNLANEYVKMIEVHETGGIWTQS